MKQRIFSLLHVPGTADCPTSSILPSFSVSQLATLQKEDEQLGDVWRRWTSDWEPTEIDTSPTLPGTSGWIKEWKRIVEKNGVLYRHVTDPAVGDIYQLLTPKKLQDRMVESAHDNWGHQGVNRTLALLKSRCFWPGITGHVRAHVRKCFKCVISKSPTPTVRPPMRHLLAFRPMERLAIDFLKLDRGWGGFEDVLVMTDAFTKYALAVPCRDQTAPVVAAVLRKEWISHYGVPLQIHSDQGRNFESKLIRELCKLYGIQKTRTSSYHAQGNGQTERFNRTLCSLIRSLDGRNRKRWPELLPHIVYMYNATPHGVTGIAPWTLLFGQKPTIPLDHLVGNVQGDIDNDYVHHQAKLIEQPYKIVKDRLTKAAECNKRYHDAKCRPIQKLEVGSRVLVKNCAFKGRHKLCDKFHEEQYLVVKCNKDDDLFEISPVLGGKGRWVNRRLLTLYSRDQLEDSSEPEVTPLQDLPCIDDLDDTDLESDGISSSDEEFVIVPDPPKEVVKPATLQPRVTVAEQVPPSQRAVSAMTPTVTKPRRSERLKHKQGSGRWPNAIT